MSLKSNLLLQNVVEITDLSDFEAVENLNKLKPDIEKYLNRNIVKERIINTVIVVSTVLSFLAISLGRFL